ncbi:MAG TPA: aminoglycoside 6-adenylyltransferase [Actinomycetota bacterium]|nr:aminoglycoside 6-adenylyltransferase [Actinomycetota bacterium]
MSTERRGDALITRLVERCAADDRIVAAFLGGSRVRGGADDHSDYDISVIVVDASYAELIAEKDGFVRLLGEPLFLEDFGNENVAFVIFADGVELELLFFREGDLPSIRSGPHRVLYDQAEILSGLEFPPPVLDPDEQMRELRNLLFWFWHDLGHFTAAIERGQLWWAVGQLEQLRRYCVSLIRIEQGVEVEDEPFWKLDAAISTDRLDPLRSTFVRVDRDELLRAGREILAFFRRQAPIVARTKGLSYPSELDALVGRHLDHT